MSWDGQRKGIQGWDFTKIKVASTRRGHDICVLGSCVLANKLWFGRFAFAVRRVYAALLYWEQYGCCRNIYIYILQKKSGTKTCRIIDNRRGPLTNPVKESASKKHEMVMSSTSDICRRTATTATTKDKIDACLRRIYTIIEHEWDEIRDVFLKIERTPWKESTSINRKHLSVSCWGGAIIM